MRDRSVVEYEGALGVTDGYDFLESLRSEPQGGGDRSVLELLRQGCGDLCSSGELDVLGVGRAIALTYSDLVVCEGGLTLRASVGNVGVVLEAVHGERPVLVRIRRAMKQ